MSDATLTRAVVIVGLTVIGILLTMFIEANTR